MGSKREKVSRSTQSGRGHSSRSGRRVDGRGRGHIDCSGRKKTRKKKATKLDNITKEIILSIGLSLVGFGEERQCVSTRLNNERFRSHFGIGPKAIVAAFKDLQKYNPSENLEVEHFLMALCWLKIYDTEHVMSGRWGYCEEYCRETVKFYVEKLQMLKKIKIRFKFAKDTDRTYLASIDCVHCAVNELRTSPNSKWFSHKFHGPGFSYEIAIDIHDDRCVWVSGPYPASSHDITIFRGGTSDSKKKVKNEANWKQDSLYFKVPKNKRLIGDSGYEGEPSKISTTMEDHTPEVKEFFARAKSRHETFNTRLKFFGILSGRFRHGKGEDDKKKLHKMCFEAACVLVQYSIELENPLMEI